MSKSVQLIKDHDVKWIDLRFTDTKGTQHHVTMPARDALDVMVILNAVNATRSAEGSRHFETRKLPARFETEFFVTSDYEFVPRRRA
jgi:glutamine synthetase